MKIPDKIETKRLIIRKFEKVDFNFFREFMLDENATKYLLFSPEEKEDSL